MVVSVSCIIVRMKAILLGEDELVYVTCFLWYLGD